MSEQFLWVEKYRPETIDECILPDKLKKVFNDIVKSGDLPNMLFSGTAGLGKTTVAKAICNQIDADYLMINGSEEGNIDTLRGKIKRFASTASFFGGRKVVILDEADYLNPQSTQPALRGFIEEFSNNCRFILTCNFKNRIIEPIHSRCGVYEFNSNKKTLASLCEQVLNRSCFILQQEGFSVAEPQRQSIAELIIRHAPDWRRVINELQRACVGGDTIKIESLSAFDTNYDVLYAALKNKDFNKMRSWVSNNVDVDASSVFRNLYDNMSQRVESNHIPSLVLILADYQYKDAFVADHELNLVACLTEVIASVDIK